MVYTEEFRKQALELVEQIGVPKASKQLHVGEMTLRTWKKKTRMAQEQRNTQLEPALEETQIKANPNVLQMDLRRELDEQIQLNRSCQQTIEYLVEENTALRQQCEKYLQAISIISQR